MLDTCLDLGPDVELPHMTSRNGFGHPCFVTGMGQVFSALGGYALVKVRAHRA